MAEASGRWESKERSVTQQSGRSCATRTASQEPRSPSVRTASLPEGMSLQPWYRQNRWAYKARPSPPAFSPLAEPLRKLVGQGLWKILIPGSSPLKTEMARQLGMEEGMELSSCFL